MSRSVLQSGYVLALIALGTPACASAQAGAGHYHALAAGSLSGTVRDAEGVPQMGALVEAVLADSTLGASAITDSQGRYKFELQPGSYRVRATAALLLPAVRDRLQIAHGTRAVVNLTLSTILAPGGWLPVSKRGAAEPGDDWMWTLRSSASRPILRYTGSDSQGNGALSVSSSRQEQRRGTSAGRVTLKDSEGGFGQGGSHNILILTRVNEDGSGAIVRADLSGPRSPFPVAPSAEVSAGLQRSTMLNGVSRAVLTYSSHPELVSGGGSTGFQGATLRSGQRIDLGDLFRVDVGSVLRVGHLSGKALATEPFVRLALRPGTNVVLTYSMTRARGTEGLEDFDRVQATMPLAYEQAGRSHFEGGSHQAFSAAGKMRGGGVAELAFYRDRYVNPTVAGVGTLAAEDLHQDGLVADPTTRTFRVATRPYSSTGVRLSVRQPVTHALQAGAEFSTGSALRTSVKGERLQSSLGNLQAVDSYVATAFLEGKVLSTGTAIRASYRWQPSRTVTQVDSFRTGETPAYFACSLRQSLSGIRALPHGLEAVVDLQNLLAEGYQPFLSSDGQTLYLAQTPRTLQAGLSFSF